MRCDGFEERVVAADEMVMHKGSPLPQGAGDLVDEGFVDTAAGLVAGPETGKRGRRALVRMRRGETARSGRLKRSSEGRYRRDGRAVAAPLGLRRWRCRTDERSERLPSEDLLVVFLRLVLLLQRFHAQFAIASSRSSPLEADRARVAVRLVVSARCGDLPGELVLESDVSGWEDSEDGVRFFGTERRVGRRRECVWICRTR